MAVLMFMNALSAIFIILLSLGQTPIAKSVLGTITAINSPITDIEVKPDNAVPVSVKVVSTTAVQRVAPGETDLKNAAAIASSDLAKGDRVLVTFGANAGEAARVVVMSAGDIAKKNQVDQQDWQRRGLSGIVAAKN